MQAADAAVFGTSPKGSFNHEMAHWMEVGSEYTTECTTTKAILQRQSPELGAVQLLGITLWLLAAEQHCNAAEAQQPRLGSQCVAPAAVLQTPAGLIMCCASLMSCKAFCA